MTLLPLTIDTTLLTFLANAAILIPMRNLLKTIRETGTRLGERSDHYTWAANLGDQRVVAKVVPRSARSPTLPRVHCTPRWSRFELLDAAQVSELELDPGVNWVLAIRPEITGRTLVEAFDSIDHVDVARQLVRGLRDLHETGVIHADIQPRNVIVDHNGRAHYIDVRLAHLTPGDAGFVAGSAPLMAPEIWAGESPTRASDRYALATLLAWFGGEYPLSASGLSQWALMHREGTPSLDHVGSIFDARVVSILTRMLARHPDERPPLQELLDALPHDDAQTPLVTSINPHQAVAELILEALETPGVAASCTCPEPDEVSIVVETIERTLEYRARTTVRVELHDASTPWTPVLALLEKLGDSSDFVPDGDQIRVFQGLTERLYTALERRPTTVVMPRFDEAPVDLRAWWNYLIERTRREARDISFLTSARTGDGTKLTPIPQKLWNSWRSNSLRAEIRSIPQKRWEQLVETRGTWITTLLPALDRELGIDSPAPSHEPRALDTSGLATIGSSFEADVEALLSQCAFGEAAARCQSLLSAVGDRSKLPSGVPSASRILELWVDAATRGARGVVETRELREALELHGSSDVRVAVARARFAQSLGEHDKVLECLHEVFERHKDLDDSASRERFAEIQALRGQSFFSSGKYEEAAAAAQVGLDRLGVLDDPLTRIHLALLESSPDALRGDRAALETLLELANESRSAPPLLLARAHSYRAIGLARRGELDESTDAYIRALEVVETAGLAAELPTFLLNVGTAYHKQGRLGLAREYYARGTRSAHATTRPSTRALLLANQANVDHALGRLEEARALVDSAFELAQKHKLTSIAANCRNLRGDLAHAEGDYTGALSTYQDLLQTWTLSDYQRTEAHLASAEALLQLDRPQDAQVNLDDARRLIEESGLSDLEHHQAMLRARLQWAQGGNLEKMAGVELFRRSLHAAQSAGNQKLVLRQSPYLVAQLEREGLDELLNEVSEIVQNSRTAIAMGLTRELRRDFFANLPHLNVRTTKPEPEETVESTVPGARPQLVDRFYRMLSLNEMILASDGLDELLPTALEIAMSLSHAERGFVLLRDTERSRIGQFSVSVSRDIDGESIAAPHLKVSLTIAEEAARTGRTVVTINAREDERFDSALSVVDLDLTSVLCVPVRDASGVLGALYLDHRFRPGVFGAEVPRMMEAFAHQVALAITNARRIEELEAERQRLADANAEVKQLLEERELMMRGLEDRVSELTEEVERRSAGSTLRDEFSHIAFTSESMERLLDQVQRVARGDIPVVVTGESGVGKELIAQAIHNSSPRRSGPFVALNCGAVSESLFESELFGHMKGSFTGATTDRKGLFLSASGGTLFLDEVGEMPLSMQVKLLRVLQEKQVRRVGSTRSEAVDVRIVAATHRELMTMVEEKTFREDLYYRLAAVTLDVPALRERREDIPIIAQTLLSNLSDGSLRLTPGAARLLTQARWRGNVRELENVLRAASVLGADGETIDEADLAPLIQLRTFDDSEPREPSAQRTKQGRRPKATRAEVVEALRRSNDDRTHAAEELGVSERTLYRYLRKWNLYD